MNNNYPGAEQQQQQYYPGYQGMPEGYPQQAGYYQQPQGMPVQGFQQAPPMMPGYQGMPMQGFPGYGYAQPGFQGMQTQAAKSWLPNERIAEMKTRRNQFAMAISPEDILDSGCNHRDEFGNLTLHRDDNTGACTCALCQSTFFMKHELSVEQVAELSSEIVNVLETMKTIHRKMDPAVARDYYQMLPLIRKIPNVWMLAKSDLQRTDQDLTNGINGQYSPNQLYAALSNPMNLSAYAQQYQGFQQAPPQGMPMQQGFQQAPPMMQQGYPAQQPMQQQPYQPQMNFNSMVQQPQQQAVANPATAPVQNPTVPQPVSQSPTQAPTPPVDNKASGVK